MSGRKRRTAAGLVLSLLLMAACMAPLAHADGDKKRVVPDYDGRDESTTAGEALLWIPRVVLSPLYLVSEYVVRRPLGFLVSAAERAQLPEAILDIFLFGPDRSAGVVPLAFVDFGFYPSFGLFFFYNDFVPHQDLQVRGSMWDEHWLAGNISDRIHVDGQMDLIFAAAAVRRPDYQFYGIGSNSLYGDISRYGASRYEGSATIEVKLSKLSKLSGSLGARRVHFHRGGYDDDRQLEEAVDGGRFETPPGYPDGYTLVFNHMQLTLDTRQPRPASGTGVRFEARAEQLSQVKPAGSAAIFRYGATLGGFLDLGANGRVVSLSLASNFVDPLRGEEEVPFTELATIGGTEYMRGFPMGRLYGRSSAVATLRYRWPVWIWLDGSIQLAFGNVFDAHLGNFSPKLLRFSGSIGVESVGSPDSSLEILLGIGSETFQHGGQITSLRIVVGTNRGF